MAIELFNDGNHRCIKFDNLVGTGEIQANQFLIIHNKRGLLFEPGGNKVYAALIAGMASYLPSQALDYILLSHQDPDVGSGLNGWLLVTGAKVLVPALWSRFIPHFCVKSFAEERLVSIPEHGMKVNLSGADMMVIPAHFLHSPGNFQLYDPISKILFSGDLGASLLPPEENIDSVAKFEEHIKFMEGFHKRYLPGGVACRGWAEMVKALEIEMIVPQHGARITGKEVAARFIDWIASLKCGLDITENLYRLPE